jgi:hypothetical protein
LVCDQVFLQIESSKLYYVFKTGKTETKNLIDQSKAVHMLDLKFSASFTNQTYEDQIRPIRWITSIVGENDSPSKNKKSLYIMLICSLVVTLAVSLLLYYRRRSLPKYWNGFRRVLLWNPR